MTKIYIGKNENPVYLDFSKSPHLLIAGATGSGKSVLLNRIIFELMKNENNKFVLIDPKHVEFYDYRNSPQLYNHHIVEDVNAAITILEKMNELIQERFTILKDKDVKDIYVFNAITGEKMNDIYIVIDELSFLILQDKRRITQLLSQIGMLGRACGVHLICATQRPDRNVISGQVQANFTSIIGLKVRDRVESNIVLKNGDLVKLNKPGEAILKNGLQYETFKVEIVDDFKINQLINDRVMSSINEIEEQEEKQSDFKNKIDFKTIITNVFKCIKAFVIGFIQEMR